MKAASAANPGEHDDGNSPCFSVRWYVAALPKDPEQSAMKMFLRALEQSMQKDYHGE